MARRRAITIFDGILHFYRIFDVVAALPAIIASVAMESDASQNPRKAAIIQIAGELLVSSAIRSLIIINLAKMPLSRCFQLPTEREPVLWLRTKLIDVIIVEVLAVLVFWIVYSYPICIDISIGFEALVLLVGTMTVAWIMWLERDIEGCLGEMTDSQEGGVFEDKQAGWHAPLLG